MVENASLTLGCQTEGPETGKWKWGVFEGALSRLHSHTRNPFTQKSHIFRVRLIAWLRLDAKSLEILQSEC